MPSQTHKLLANRGNSLGYVHLGGNCVFLGSGPYSREHVGYQNRLVDQIEYVLFSTLLYTAVSVSNPENEPLHVRR